jgi:hypothetical protein
MTRIGRARAEEGWAGLNPSARRALPRRLRLGMIQSGLLATLVPVALLAAPGSGQEDRELAAALQKEGLVLDLATGMVALPAAVQVKHDLLEYLLVAPNGAAHESLFLTRVRPSLLNAALLLTGVEPGKNAWVETLPAAEGTSADRPERRVHPPEGDGFFLYAAWREAGEVYFYRLEDLVRNFATGRGLRRHRWVYLGSRFLSLKPGESESYLADVEGNLVNLSFFFQGNTLLTAALPECYEQTIWAANEWLLPDTGAPLLLVFARAPLEAVPASLRDRLPEVPASSTTPGEAGK